MGFNELGTHQSSSKLQERESQQRTGITGAAAREGQVSERPRAEGRPRALWEAEGGLWAARAAGQGARRLPQHTYRVHTLQQWLT